MTTPIGAYSPGRSPLHRLPAGFKLLALAAGIVVTAIVVTTPFGATVALACAGAVFLAAGVGPSRAWPLMRGPLVMVTIVFVFQLIVTDLSRAYVVCAVLLSSIALAVVVTLTTRTNDMLDALVRVLSPLKRLGVRVDLVAMAFALAIRAIPLIAEIAIQVDQARRARGLRPGPRILIVPVVLAALGTADGFADTLAARGLD